MKKIILLTMLFLLVGCMNKQEIQLDFIEVVEYETEFIDACTLIKSIDEVEIESHHYEKGKIQTKEYAVDCPEINVRKLGKKSVDVVINGQKYEFDFEVVDTTPPIIEIEDTLKVEVENEYFDITKMINVYDDYDIEPQIGYSGSVDLNAPGIYKITVSATDSNKNESNKDVEIEVVEKEITVIEKEVIVHVPSSSNSTSQSGGSTSTPPSQSSGATSSFLPGKDFLFANGYDMNTGFDACVSYMSGYSGGCQPIENNEGIAIGYRYHH